MEKSRGKQHIACPGVSGGAEGSRTPVRKHFDRTFSGRSPVSTFPPCADTGQTAQFSRVIVHGRGNSYPPHVRHINDAFPGLWPLRFRRLPLVRQRQQYDCCQLILSCPFLGGQAPPPAYPASTPPSKPVQPHISFAIWRDRMMFAYLFPYPPPRRRSVRERGVSVIFRRDRPACRAQDIPRPGCPP